MSIEDFYQILLDDTTNANYIDGYDPKGDTISQGLLSNVEALDGLEATGRLYSNETAVTLSEQAMENIRGYYKQQDRLAPVEGDTEWMAGYNRATSGETDSVVYSVDGLVLDELGKSQYLMDGTFDAEQFATGEYVMAIGIGTDDFTFLSTASRELSAIYSSYGAKLPFGWRITSCVGNLHIL